MQLALHVDEHGFTWRDVAHKPVARAFQGHRLAADHPGAIRPFAQTQWPNAIGVAKRHHAVACNHGHHRIRTFDTRVHTSHGGKHIDVREHQAARGFLQLVGQHIQQHLGVAFGVDVAMVGGKQIGLQ